MKHGLGLLLIPLLAACGSTGVEPPPDAGTVVDGGSPDAQTSTHADAGPLDTGPTFSEVVLAASWRQLANAPTVTRGKQDDIYFTSPRRGFAVSGQTSSIYRTDDGGESWSTVETHAGTYFRSLVFADPQHGFAGSLGVIPQSSFNDPNVLYQTADGGDTWTPVTTITGPMPSGVCNQTKIDDLHLIGVGRVMGPSHLIRSGDGGATWTSIDLGSQLQMLIDARFTSPTEGIVVGGTAGNPMRCSILRTTDGEHFEPVFTSDTFNSLCWKISFPSPLVGYVSIQDTDTGPGTFAKTIDGGQTWTEMPLVSEAYGAIGIGFITDEIGWVSSDDPTQPTYRTTDGGATWTPDPVLRSPINRFRFVDRQTAYAIGGRVYKLEIPWPDP